MSYFCSNVIHLVLTCSVFFRWDPFISWIRGKCIRNDQVLEWKVHYGRVPKSWSNSGTTLPEGSTPFRGTSQLIETSKNTKFRFIFPGFLFLIFRWNLNSLPQLNENKLFYVKNYFGSFVITLVNTGDLKSKLVIQIIGICLFIKWFAIQMLGPMEVWYSDHHLINRLVFRLPFEYRSANQMPNLKSEPSE